MRRLSLGFIAILIAVAGHSQDITKAKFGKGMRILAKDSSFYMRAAMRFQTLFEARAPIVNDTVQFDQTGTSFQIRRARLKFDGFVHTPKLKYKIELGLSNKDISGAALKQNNNAPRVILDAVAKWNFYKNFTLWAGQTKLPGNRERVVSSAKLQFVDRSLVNKRFNIDRDMGVQLRHKGKIGEMVFNNIFSISQGEGRGITSGNAGGYCYTYRAEWLPFGKFTSKGDYFNADTKREEKPKLSLAITFDNNDNAVRSGGQLGKFITDEIDVDKTQFRTLHSAMFDLMFKYKGFSIMSEYVEKQADENPTVFDQWGNSFTYFTGKGLNYQMGYVCKNNVEIAGRYTVIEPHDATGNPDQRQYTLCVSRYIVDHALKIQTDVSFLEEKAQGASAYRGDEVMYRIQFDLHF